MYRPSSCLFFIVIKVNFLVFYLFFFNFIHLFIYSCILLVHDLIITYSALSLFYCFSEQRRGFQLQYSGESSAKLDTLMRDAWEQLKEKDKLRYFMRAKSALQDRAQDKKEQIRMSNSSFNYFHFILSIFRIRSQY